MSVVIHIVKGKPPKELLEKLCELRSTPGASVSWENLTDREPIRESLCREQGHLCAYCMRKITVASSHVEHIVPQCKCKPGQDVDYNNLLAVCDGNEGSGQRGALTCDRARQDAPLKVNPLRPETLASIRYRKNGIIYSDDEGIQKDLDETLNLNCEAAYLPQNRKAVIAEFYRWLEKASQHGNVVGACRKQYEEIAESECKKAFAGVVLYFLARRIRRG